MRRSIVVPERWAPTMKTGSSGSFDASLRIATGDARSAETYSLEWSNIVRRALEDVRCCTRAVLQKNDGALVGRMRGHLCWCVRDGLRTRAQRSRQIC